MFHDVNGLDDEMALKGVIEDTKRMFDYKQDVEKLERLSRMKNKVNDIYKQKEAVISNSIQDLNKKLKQSEKTAAEEKSKAEMMMKELENKENEKKQIQNEIENKNQEYIKAEKQVEKLKQELELLELEVGAYEEAASEKNEKGSSKGNRRESVEQSKILEEMELMKILKLYASIMPVDWDVDDYPKRISGRISNSDYIESFNFDPMSMSEADVGKEIWKLYR